MIIRRIWPPPRGFQRAYERLEDMRRDMERLFEAVAGPALTETAGVYPPLNVTEDADNYYIRAEIPGVKVDDIELSAMRTSVSISGKRDIAVEAASYHRREREGGSFSRSIKLPSEINANRIEARYTDGILTLLIPKAEEAKPRQITVKAS